MSYVKCLDYKFYAHLQLVHRDGLTFVQEIESLREAEQYNQVNYAERKHVTGDHRINHRNEWTSQSHSTGKKHKQKPTARHGEQ